MIVSGKMGPYSREGLCPLTPLRAPCYSDSRISALLGWVRHEPYDWKAISSRMDAPCPQQRWSLS